LDRTHSRASKYRLGVMSYGGFSAIRLFIFQEIRGTGWQRIPGQLEEELRNEGKSRFRLHKVYEERGR
jgi:hypothetical protein